MTRHLSEGFYRRGVDQVNSWCKRIPGRMVSKALNQGYTWCVEESPRIVM